MSLDYLWCVSVCGPVDRLPGHGVLYYISQKMDGWIDGWKQTELHSLHIFTKYIFLGFIYRFYQARSMKILTRSKLNFQNCAECDPNPAPQKRPGRAVQRPSVLCQAATASWSDSETGSWQKVNPRQSCQIMPVGASLVRGGSRSTGRQS